MVLLLNFGLNPINSALLNLLRTNQFVGNGLLILYLILVRFPFYLDPKYPSYYYEGGIAWNFLSEGGITLQHTGNLILAACLAIGIGVGINIIENKWRLSGELNLIAGAMFILFASLFPNFMVLSPVLLSLPFFLGFIHGLIKSYKDPKPAKNLFNIGFLIACASFFFPPASLFIIFVIAGLSTMRSLKVKEILIVLVGWLSLYIIGGSWHYWNHQFDYFLNTQIGKILGFVDWHWALDFPYAWFPVAVVSLVLFSSLAGIGKFQLKKSLISKKAISLFYLYLLFVALLGFFIQDGSVEYLLLGLLPLSLFFNFSLLSMKPSSAEGLHFLLLFFLIFLQFVF